MPGQDRFTRSEKALLRSLVEDAWNAELDDSLAALFEDFCKWADKGMSALELAERIHEFHDGIAREAYNRYTTLDPSITISRAIALKLIESESLAEPLLQKLAPSIALFEHRNDE